MGDTSNAMDTSKLLYIPRVDEQDAECAADSARNGAFIGFSKVYSMPFFLDPDRLMNPHVFIAGITGSGKTYLTKNLMLKLYGILGCIVIAIDFTGEYAEFASLFSAVSCSEGTVGKAIGEGMNRIIYISLKGVGEREKVRSANAVLNAVAGGMRIRGDADKNRRIFVILDEAWKLMEKSRPLEIIIREGRKYRVGIIIASQIIGDLDASFLSNIATLFVFRIQDKGSLEVLQRNYGLRDGQVSSMQNLELGSRFVIQVNKSSSRETFCIRRVVGIEAAAPVRIFVGGNMNVEVRMTKFETFVRRMCSSERASEIISRARERGLVRLDVLIAELIGSGADRRRILHELQAFGVREDDLADAFAAAVSVAGNADGA